MSERELPILFQDEHLVAVNKPSGLLVHRSEIDRHETEFALQIVRDQVGKKLFPVHRLDRPTSGVLVFALSSDIARQLSAEFSERRVVKTYRAIVRGHILHAGQIDHAIVAEPAFKTGSLAKIKAEPQPAVTRFVPLERFELPHAVGRYQTCRFSLVELFPRTGRRHQLRRHMSHISHPIVGDTTHGDGNYNRFARAHFEVRRLLLVAWSLEFEHPASAERVVIHADCGVEFESVLNALRRESTDGTGSR